MKTLVFAVVLSCFLVPVWAQETQTKPVPDTRPEALGKQKDKSVAYLGIVMQSDGKVIRVEHVQKDSPAAKAGLSVGADIIGIDGKTVEGDPAVVADAIRAKRPGEEIELQWRIDNGERFARITLGSRTLAEREAEMKELSGFSSKVKERIREGALKELAPGVEVDPYKNDQVKKKRLRVQPPWDRRDFDLDVPLRDLEGGYFLREKPGKFEGGKVEGTLRQGKAQDEKAVWDMVQKRVAGALEKSDLDAGVKGKVMQALEDARREGAQQQARRERLEAEINQLEKSARDLQDRAGKLRQELKESGGR